MTPTRLAGLLLFLLASTAQAQQPFQIWYAYNHAGRLTDKWGYTFDVNHRTREVLPAEAALSAIRVGGSYQLTPSLRLTAGYAWFGTYVPDIDRIWVHENRLYQQAQWNFRPKGLALSHRVRLEERWRELLVNANQPFDPIKRDVFNLRARYMIQLTGPITRRDSTGSAFLSWQAANEVFFQTTEYTGLFDQNRTLAGLVWHISPGLDLATLYQFIVQRRPEFDTTQGIHSVRLTLFHSLDLRKKKDYAPVPAEELSLRRPVR
jgi:hypothetical protein